MTNAQHLEAAAIELFAKYKLNEWKFVIEDAYKPEVSVAQCRYYSKTIAMKTLYVKTHSLERLIQSLLHEVAHAIAGCEAGHNAKWERIARAIGCENPSAQGVTSDEYRVQVYKYQIAVQHDDGIIEKIPDCLAIRRSKLTGRFVAGRPETKGKLIWVPFEI